VTHQSLDRRPCDVELAFQTRAFDVGQNDRLHESIHEETVCGVGRDTACRRVRVEEITLLLQIAHRIADRGGGDAEFEAARDRATPGRLGRIHIGADDGIQYLAFSFGQFGTDQLSSLNPAHVRRSRVTDRGVNPQDRVCRPSGWPARGTSSTACKLNHELVEQEPALCAQPQRALRRQRPPAL